MSQNEKLSNQFFSSLINTSCSHFLDSVAIKMLNQQFRFIDRISGDSITWVDDFVLSLAVLRVSLLITFKHLNQLKICMDDPLPLVWFIARRTLWCYWWNTPWKKKTIENLLSSTQIWSFCPPKLPPTNLPYVSCYMSNDNTRLFTGLLPGSGVGLGWVPSDHQITTLGCVRSPAWISSETILLIDTKFQNLLSWVVSPPDFTECYFVNHLYPVDSSQRTEEEHSFCFLFQPFLSSLRSPASAVTSPSSAWAKEHGIVWITAWWFDWLHSKMLDS